MSTKITLYISDEFAPEVKDFVNCHPTVSLSEIFKDAVRTAIKKSKEIKEVA